MPKAKLEELEGKCTGVLEEGENIKLKIISLHELWYASAIVLFHTHIHATCPIPPTPTHAHPHTLVHTCVHLNTKKKGTHTRTYFQT